MLSTLQNKKAKDNVSDFKRGVVEERENDRNSVHRNAICTGKISHRKKQELQKAQEAKQTVHANGSATAGATRSHERPVATPVPKPAPTDTVKNNSAQIVNDTGFHQGEGY